MPKRSAFDVERLRRVLKEQYQVVTRGQALPCLHPAGPDVADVLIQWATRRQSTGFVRVNRTRRMPERMFVTGPIRLTKPARAVSDAARGLTRFDDVRHVACDAVQRRACTVAELAAELSAGPAKGSTLFREAPELATGHSVACHFPLDPGARTTARSAGRTGETPR